jgi:aminoglycoside 3-N-acetyltransferase
MVSFREISSGLRQLGLQQQQPVIVHSSLSAFGEVKGGIATLLGAVLGTFDAVMVPTFTYKTMLIPEDGPENNAFTYGAGHDTNQMAESFRPDMPADRMMGIFAETLRQRPGTVRSSHPILSFAGLNMDSALQAQTLQEPFAPIRVLAEQGGWVLLLGTDNTVNTSIHYAEKLAGRKQFMRWALMPDSIAECPGWPGCSDGFNQAASVLADITCKVNIGQALVQAMPLQIMCEMLVDLIQKEPLALLCQRQSCERCDAVRQAVNLQQQTEA